MKRLNLIWGAILSMALIACGGSDGTSLDDLYGDDYSSPASVYIDNGADTTVLVTITSKADDGETFEFEIESYGLEFTSLPYGKYHITAITVTDSTIVDEDFKLDADDYEYSYNLNLTKQDYIVENIEYVVGATGDESINKTFTYQGKTYNEVDADVIKGALVIPSAWDYNLDEESPEEVTLYDGDTRTTKRKLYRSSTFILYLELIELFGDYDWSEEEEY